VDAIDTLKLRNQIVSNLNTSKIKNDIIDNDELLKFYILSEKERGMKQKHPTRIDSKMSLNQFMEVTGLNKIIQNK